MTNLNSVLKSRDITVSTKIHIVKAMVHPVVMYRYESWIIKKPEHQTMNTFKLWWWRRFLSPLGSKEIKPVSPKGNQPWIFIGRIDAKAETPILWPPVARADSLERPWCWERLRAGEGDHRGWDGWMASLTQWTWVWVNSRNWWLTGRPGMLQSMGLQRVGHNWATELNWLADFGLRTPWSSKCTFLDCMAI